MEGLGRGIGEALTVAAVFIAAAVPIIIGLAIGFGLSLYGLESAAKYVVALGTIAGGLAALWVGVNA